MISQKVRNSGSARCAISLFCAVGVLLGSYGFAADQANQQSPNAQAVFPLTTKSSEARRLVEEAWRLSLDLVESAKAGEVLRKAVKVDPDFAMGHELLAQISLDPAEQVSEQQKAFALRTHASQPEQTVIEWWQDSADHNLISAITKMNSVLNQYPHDKWVVFLSTGWLTLQTQYERSVAVYERSGLADSPGLMNNTAYNYAYMRQFDKAFDLMDRYVAALPKDPNPQDSYAEILRMAGKFDKAIERYRAALDINPDFYSSEFGIADTYSLMGDQPRARKEYEAAFKKFSELPELHRVQWQTRAATTFIREGDYVGADRAFQATADYAHSRHMSQVEADTYTKMAIYQSNPKRALALLEKAQSAIKEGENTMAAAIQQELAQVLRVRVEIAVKLGDNKTARSLVAELAEMAESSNDKLIETAYHGAAGAQLFAEQKYDQAISHLEEDVSNPLSLRLLATSYQKIGYSAGAKRTSETLANLYDPTLEQALVVPAFRKCYLDASCSSDVKGASLKR
jgi:tetratricopeptide (TPR) repeat protein